MTKEHTRDNPGCPQLSWDRWDNLDLGLGGAIHHARDNLGCPCLDLGLTGRHLQALVASADGGSRKKFAVIDKDDMLQSVSN